MLKTETTHQTNKSFGQFIKPIFLLHIITGATLLSVANPAYSASCKIPKSYYKNVTCTSDSRYFLAVKDTGSPVALLNKQGKKTTDLFAYEQVLARKMQDGLLPVMKKGKVGYINSRGVVAVPTVYDSLGGANWARGFNNSRVVVKKSGKWGVVTTSNRVIVPFSASISTISDFSAGKAEMIKSGATLIIDTKGKSRKARPAKRPSSSYSNSRSSSASGSRQTNQRSSQASANSRQSKVAGNQSAKTRLSQQTTRVMNSVARKSTEVSLPDSRINELLTNYQLIPPTSSSRQPIEPQPKPFIKNKTLNSSVNQMSQINKPSVLNTSGIDSQNLTHATERGVKLIPKRNSEGKWGFDDVQGVNMITYSFDEVKPFSSGLAGVKLANNWGFINQAGDLVISFRFNDEGVRSSDKDTYKGFPPFVFNGEKAWIGSLRDGTKLCIDKEGVNVSCDK